MTIFDFKPEEETKLRSEWPLVWERVRMRFYWFADRCAINLKMPPPIITCLARTPEENLAVGGVPRSLHMARPVRAIDIRRSGYDDWADEMEQLWRSAGIGWDFVREGPPYNEKAPHFHLEADWRVT